MRIMVFVMLMLFFGSFFVLVQEVKLSFVIGQVEIEDNVFVVCGVKQKLENRLKKDYDVLFFSYIILYVIGNFGEMYIINGMDIYIVVDVDLIYFLFVEGLLNCSKMFFIKCKGINEKDLVIKLGIIMVRDRVYYDEVYVFIQEYIQENFGICIKIISVINEWFVNYEMVKVNSLLGYYDVLSNCQEVKSSVEQAILDKYQAYVCDVIIKKSIIFVNSGFWQDFSKVIDMFLMVFFDVFCVEKAILVLELVSKKVKELDGYFMQQFQK